MSDRRMSIEYIVITLILAILLVLLVIAIRNARAAVRDDLRKTDLSHLKRGNELYYNQHNSYPSAPDKTLECTSSNDPDSWFFGNRSPLLIEQYLNAVPHDVREHRGYVYRYCLTENNGGLVLGYYFEAQLERGEESVIAFDDDEARKYNYRILREGGKTLYRVCGGTEKRCDPF